MKLELSKKGSKLVIGTSHEVGLVTSSVVIQTVHSLLVGIQGEVGNGRSQIPDLGNTKKERMACEV